MSEPNTFADNFQELLKSIEKQTVDLLENVAETFVGKAEPLRDGTEFDEVALPCDLYAHRGVQTEWWYYTGHAETVSGNQFGFELVFFKRRTDLDKFSMIPMRLFGNPIYFAHFAITDYGTKKFRYAHRKSANGLFDFPASMSEKHYHLRLGDWTIRESNGAHILRASINSEITFEATLKPSKAVILNGKDGKGVSYKDEGEASRYFSYTRMEMDGDIIWNGETEHFAGSAWMDREFGTWAPTENQKGWDWFSVQLDDGTELMCYQIRNRAGGVSSFSSGVFIDKDGNSTYLSNREFKVQPTGYWKSAKTKAVYPNGWKLSVPKLELVLTVTPVLDNQELDTRGTTMIIYWEGACHVKGATKATNGKAYVELVGYDRSHEAPNLAYFLMGNSFEFPPKSFF